MLTIHRTKIYRYLIFFLILTVMGGIGASAQESKNKIVRVGWYESPFTQTDALGNRSGYAYEYQLRIGALAGWTYEYVDGTWPNLLEMLKSGEIDLLSDVSDISEREEFMLFSDLAMAHEEYMMMVPKVGSTIQIGNPKTVNGKRIGIEKSSVQVKLLKEWLKTNGVKCEIVELNTVSEVLKDLLGDGEIDGLVAPTNIDRGRFVPAFDIGAAEVHFAVNKAKPELKSELDEAMAQIRSTTPSFMHMLSGKYQSNFLYNVYLPEHECQWLQQKKKIRIGYRDNYLPFCTFDVVTGELDGLLKDFIDNSKGAFDNADFEIEAIAYPSIMEAVEAVKRGEVDAAFPHGIELSDAEKEGLVLTDCLYNSIEMAVMRKDSKFTPGDTLRAGLNNNNPNYLSLLRSHYPQWKTVNYPSTPDCLKGIAKGETDLMLLSSYRLGVLAKEVHRNSLKSVPTGITISYGFATKTGETELYNILSRLSDLMDESFVQSSIISHSDVSVETTTREFIEQHAFAFFGFILAILAVFIYLLRRAQEERSNAVNLSISQKIHIKEIQTLNNELEERQAQLEEITAEQEAQIEEIQALNTELVESREEIENAKMEAEAANAAKTSFLFNMSHDIRTPMNAIIGFTNLLRKHQDEAERREDYLEKIEKSSAVLLSIINNVLEMARIEKGTIELTPVPCYAMDFNQSIQDIFKDMMKNKGLDFISTADIQHDHVCVDLTMLREIFYNILSNAYKYTEKGSVTMSLKELPSDREGYVIYQTTITDTGVGMSEEFLPHLFDEFARERNTTDNKIEGTGLGMPIVKRLVEIMEGTIEVKSKKGEGSCFIVTLPHKIANGNANLEPEAVDFNISDFEGKRILLAEDNDLNAEIAAELLGEVGLIVERAEDGIQCLEMMEKADASYYDAILMDVQMPNMNGYETTRAIRQLTDPSKANVPILAMTANAFEEDKLEASRAGMNGHLAKPINVFELMKALAVYIKR